MWTRRVAAQLCAGGIFIACGPAALAQAPRPSWSGPYLGIDIGGGFLEGSRTRGAITPYGYPGFSTATPPPSTGYRTGTATADAPIGGLRGGYLFDFDRFVIGVEGEVNTGGTTGAASAGASYAADAANICGQGSLGCLTGAARDSVTVRTSLDWSGSLRARIGLPIGDNLLLSAFGGPSFLSASLRASQSAAATSLNIAFTGFHFFSNETDLSGVTAASRSQTLIGGTFGGQIDYRIDQHWMLRGEYGVSIYPSLTVRLPEGAAAASSAAFSPTLHAVRLGVAYKF
jgi:opacity protein-like surface antigen